MGNSQNRIAHSSLFHQSSPAARRWARWSVVLGFVALAALALTPLVVDYGTRDDAYFGPKWAWMAIWTAVGLAAVAAGALAGRPAMFHFDAVWIAALLFVLWHWVRIIGAPSPSLAIERAAQVSWLLGAMWLGLQLLTRRRDLIRLAWFLIGVALATAAWTLVEDTVRAWAPEAVWIRPNLADWRGYLGAGLGNTNHIADLLALAFIAALVLFGESRGRGPGAWARRIMLFLAAGVFLPKALIVCFSVGSTVGLLLGLAVTAALVLRRRGVAWFTRRPARWALITIFWVASVVLFTTDNPLNPHRPGIFAEAFGSDRLAAGWPTRLAIWSQTLEMIRLNPFAGVGTGNFTFIFPEMDSQLITGRPDLLAWQGLWTNAAHNVILQTWAELGVVGLFLLLMLLATAYYSLLKGLDRADRPSLMARATLAGLLTAWIVHGQMNFVLMHPTGALSLFAILMAIVIEKRTRRRRGAAPMPPLRWETDWLAVRVDWHTMKKPTAVGVALLLPGRVAIALGAAAIVAALAWAPLRWRPVLSQREYARAAAARTPAEAEAHFARALALDPCDTNARSRYSAWLIEQGRPVEALEELAKVRERLNSNELWLRQAAALEALGRHDEALAARETYYQRVWLARQGEAGK